MREHIQHRAALALVDSELWDMHRPLTSTCNVEFLYFDSEDPSVLNNVFWESCSIILGAVICNAFKDSVSITPHSYPPANSMYKIFIFYTHRIPVKQKYNLYLVKNNNNFSFLQLMCQ